MSVFGLVYVDQTCGFGLKWRQKVNDSKGKSSVAVGSGP